jgi:site-specific recombinase XerD
MQVVQSFRKQNLALVEKFDEWLLVRHYSAHTRKRYRCILGDFCKSIGSTSVTSAGSGDIQQFLASLLDRRLAPPTVAQNVYALRTFLRFLNLGGLGRLTPAAILTRKVPRKMARVLSSEEVEKLLGAAATARDSAILELLYASGIRAAELLKLRAEDLHLRAGTVLIRQGKGDKDRIAYFGRPAARALGEYLHARKTGYVFARRGRPLSYTALRLTVRRVVRRAGLDGVHAHTLRHTFATHLLNGGADIRYVQEFLGHGSLVATQHYTHLAIGNLVDSLRRCHPHG